MIDKGILIVPACENGRGGGHLTRCVKLISDLHSMGRTAFLFLPLVTEKISMLFQSMNFNLNLLITESGLQDSELNIDFIILDRFETSKEELFRWKEKAPVIGIDEGGKYRDYFDFLIDILIPKRIASSPANITTPSLLNFPACTLSQKEISNGKIKVLISFGHEDPAGLGLSVAKKILKQNDINLEITLLTGGLSNNLYENLSNITIKKSIPNLAEHLGEYDIVITHYGITAYEALYTGTPVMLASPTGYHGKLERAAGFYSYSSIQKIDNEFLTKLKKHCKEQSLILGLNNINQTLVDLVKSFSPIVNRSCPICGKETGSNSLTRFFDRTYRRCRHCGIIYMDRTCPPPFEYGKEYFLEMYQKQYGKTYIEDFPNLMEMSKRRLSVIKSLLKKTNTPLLLDIGCAYGPFLAAARDEGFSPHGIDPAQDAVSYVNEKLKIPAVTGFFPDTALPFPARFDTVTLWFVMEHFQNCVSMLAEINKILNPGGILAFSTPAGSGVSGRSSIKNFLRNSPSDHFTIWSPKMCKKALALYGFKVKKIIISGHHPERFPLFGKLASNRKSPFYWILLAASKIFSLGDTFEVYAEKA